MLSGELHLQGREVNLLQNSVGYSQVWFTATNFQVSWDGAVVVLVVQVLVIAAVLLPMAKVHPKHDLAADVKVSTHGKGSLLADAENPKMKFLLLISYFQKINKIKNKIGDFYRF